MERTRPAADSLKEYARGIGGGLIFSLPLLYTMELWWIGHTASPLRLGLFMAGTFGLLLLYNVVAGVRPDEGWSDVVYESVEEMGLGLLLAAGLLVLLGRLGLPEASYVEVVGKVIVEGMVAAIGISVGTAQLGARPEDEEDERSSGWGREAALALCGAVLIAAPMAPTEEVLLIAVGMKPITLLGAVVFSLGVTAGLVYYSDIHGAEGRSEDEGLVGVAGGTAVTYVMALAAAGALLWVTGQFDGVGWGTRLAEGIVLGIPASLGAAAGQLLLGRAR